MLPDTFIGIEIRSIGWELLYVNQPCPTAGQQRLDLLSAMNTETIPDDQQFPAQIMRHMAQKQFTVLAAHHRQMLASQQDFQEWRITSRGVSSYHSGQQVEGSLINTSNHAVFATRLFLSSGQTSLRQCAISASLRRMSCTAGICGVQSNCLSKRATWLLWRSE